MSAIDDNIGALALRGMRILFKRSGAILIAGIVPSQKVNIDIIPRIGLLNVATTKTTPYKNPHGKKIDRKPKREDLKDSFWSFWE